jgi:hypothetical protein
LEFRKYNHRFAEEILRSEKLRDDEAAIRDIVQRAPFIVREGKQVKLPGKARQGVKQLDQKELNRWFKKEFTDRLWKPGPYVMGTADETGLAADFRKDKIQVEVQFGNIARAFYDVFKMQVGFQSDQMDVGVLIVPDQKLSKITGQNIASFERIKRELEIAHTTITLPIWIIGLSQGPDSTGPEPAEPPAVQIPEVLRRAGPRQAMLLELTEDASAPSPPSPQSKRPRRRARLS